MPVKERIKLVDALRGFALFGILALHFIEHFDLLKYPETSNAFLKSLDASINEILFFIFAGKSYSIFALLFGFSFYIQMNNYLEKGIDFSKRFLWRLAILFMLGYVHSLFYCGDILTVFGLMGMVLIIANRFSNKTLLITSLILIANPPLLFSVIYNFINPEYVYSQYWGDVWNRAFDTFATGSFSDVISFNSISGHYAKVIYTFNSGRYLQMPGLFLLGLLIGRSKYFEFPEKYKSLTQKILTGSIISFLVVYVLQVNNLFMILNDSQKFVVDSGLTYFSKLIFTILLMSAFILVYQLIKDKVNINWLANYGRMSLTNYTSQAIFGVILFYNYGFGMYEEMGVALSFSAGLMFFTLQCLFSSWWLKSNRFGPLEYLWRKLTLLSFEKEKNAELILQKEEK